MVGTCGSNAHALCASAVRILSRVGITHGLAGGAGTGAGAGGANAGKRAVNLSVPADLLEAAREAGINLSALLERALRSELARHRRRRWREENAAAISAYNRIVERRGTFSTGPWNR